MNAKMHKVRPFRPADAPAIAEVFFQTVRATYWQLADERASARLSAEQKTGEWLKQLEQLGPSQRVFVADKGPGKIGGFVAGGPARVCIHACRGEVYMLYVRNNRRRRGLGRTLFSHCLSSLFSSHLSPVVAWVVADNPARSFYEALGGVQAVARQDRAYGVRHTQIAYVWQTDPSFVCGGGSVFDYESTVS